MTTVILALVLLNPVRLYFQPDQPIMLAVDTQAIARLVEDGSAAGPLTLQLIRDKGDGDQTIVATAKLEAAAKEIDLMQVFDGKNGQRGNLWDGQTYYIQLVAGDKPIGSPLVVVPLFPPGQKNKVPANALRIYPEKLVEFQTTLGSMAIRLDAAAAPNTTLQFSELVQGGFYTNVIFHRVIADFVIQGGDPTGSGTGGPGYYTDLESSNKPHDRGTVSMARQGHDVNTSGSQFFICLSRRGCAPLDRQYTAFGDLVWGLDVVDKIVALPTLPGGANRPVTPPAILRATLIPAPPRDGSKRVPAQLPRPTPAP